MSLNLNSQYSPYQLAAAAIFTFRIAWNEYLLASALADRDTITVPILIVNNASEFDGLGTIFATGMLLDATPRRVSSVFQSPLAWVL